MTTDPTFPAEPAAETELFLGADWFDPLEAGVRTRIRSFIEELLEAELEAALSRATVHSVSPLPSPAEARPLRRSLARSSYWKWGLSGGLAAQLVRSQTRRT
jgi:hypothetical protein